MARISDTGAVAIAGIALLAQICHEVNAAYCRSIGDDSQPSWDDAPDWQRTSAINGVEFHLANPEAGDSASHENWMAEKVKAGWVYGEVKDLQKGTHPCIVPFDQLPKEQQAKDALFRAVVHAGKDLALGFDAAVIVRDAQKLEIEGLKRTLSAHKGQATRARQDRDDALTKLAARPAAATARDVPPAGEDNGLLTGSRAYELAVAADKAEVVATNGSSEILGIPPLQVSAADWRYIGDRLTLSPEVSFKVHGPAPESEPFRVAGYALYADGELIAVGQRDPQISIGAGQTYNLAGDIAF